MIGCGLDGKLGQDWDPWTSFWTRYQTFGFICIDENIVTEVAKGAVLCCFIGLRVYCVSVLHKINSVSVKKTGQIMLFSKIIARNFENYTKHVKALCEQSADFEY
jgi:hypothetical protein